MSISFVLSLIQMRVDGGCKKANLDRAKRLAGKAAKEGAKVVLLPEAMDLGWCHSSARSEADTIPDGQTCKALREMAREHAVFLCSGLVERAGTECFNAAVLVDPDGELLLHHRKLNELDIARDLYARGGRLGAAATRFGKFGLMICADGFAPGQIVSRTLGLMGAQIILSPCAWAVPADHDNKRDPYGRLWLDNYCPVARERKVWIAGCSNVGPISDGPWKGRHCIGSSLVVGPEGDEKLRGPYGVDAEAILNLEVKL